MNKYDVPINFETENSISLIIEQIKPNSTILEFGPATGRMTKYLSEELSCSVYIVEIDKDAYDNAIKYAKDGICSDIEKYVWLHYFKNVKFDYILFADVLEHLINPKEVLVKSKGLLSEGGRLITSIPNIAHNSIIIELINNRFSYTQTGILDATHLRFFTYYSLHQLFEDCDLVIETEKVVRVSVEDISFNCSYQNVSNKEAEELKKREFANVYQFVFTLIDKNYYYKNINNIKIRKLVKEEIHGSSLLQSVFIDNGTGFSEDNKLSQRINLIDNKFNFNIDLSGFENVLRLRFDPCEFACKVKMGKVYSNVDELTIIPENITFNENDFDVFMHKDPIYNLYSKDINNIRQLNITGELVSINAYEIENYYNSRRKVCEDKCEELSNNIIKKDNQNLILKEDLENAKYESKLLTDKVNILYKNLEEKNSDINLLQESIKTKIEELNKLNITLNKRDSEIGILQENLNRSIQEDIIKNNEIMKYKGLIANKDKEIQILNDNVNTRTKQLNEVYMSKSWKCTKPLREFSKFIKKVESYSIKKASLLDNRTLTLIDKNIETKQRHYDAFVSVVIPTYNGQNDIQMLLKRLHEQKGIKKLEIIIVDSGSADNTISICEDYHTQIIKISQSEFCHSYARNLGATNAKGDYILFMTQDALPSNDYWLYNMLTPILKHGIVAVSCSEKPREDCELSYLIESYNFAKYLGILNNDKIGKLPKIQNYETLRINGQLNDISCLIIKKVFDNFKYYGDYAEDLDLGIRLIKSGYRIAILSSEKVIHSHNRSCGYYLKRSIVDSKNLKKILPDFPVTENTNENVISAILFAYYKVICLLDYLEDNITKEQSANDYFYNISNYLEKINSIEKVPVNIMQYGKQYSDYVVDNFINELLLLYKENYVSNNYILNHIIYFVNNSLITYVNNHYSIVDSYLKKQIIDTIYKRFVIISGNEISLYIISNPLDQQFKSLVDDLQKGV